MTAHALDDWGFGSSGLVATFDRQVYWPWLLTALSNTRPCSQSALSKAFQLSAMEAALEPAGILCSNGFCTETLQSTRGLAICWPCADTSSGLG